METKQPWYKEQTFRWTLTAITAMGVAFTVGTWINDGQFNWETPLLFLSGIVMVIGLTWLFRNNP